jgi:hypothetical protein
MARPIKETPILTGEDSKRFTQRMKEAEAKPVDKAERDRIRENFAKLNAIAKF